MTLLVDRLRMLPERWALTPRSVSPRTARELRTLFKRLRGMPGARATASRALINYYAYTTTPRPRALSMAADYTSWASLTDRSFTGRHLPPSTTPESELPSEADVNALFRRSDLIPSTATSVMFSFFAQWFTDSFLRTDRTDFRKNTSNHEIDLCQIYGLDATKTDMLRAHEGGLLQSQRINGREYPPFLFQPRSPGGELKFKPEFEGLHDSSFLMNVLLRDCPDERKDFVFAVGLENGNSTIGHTILNVVFLREHNRIARVLEFEHSGWDDDRLFETTRNIMIVLMLKVVVEDYIQHISPFDFPIEVVPFIADGEYWNRQNWIAIEFNLLYRWHSLVPDVIGTGADRLEATEFINNNPLVIERGVEALVSELSGERAGKIGLLNTPAFLTDPIHPGEPSVTERTISLMRKARLRTFNDYREAFGLHRLESFEHLTKNAELRAKLEALYGSIDNLEWYVGIFAEDYPEQNMMGELLATMVAYDAFTQALTSPLLARNVFNNNTFTETGMSIIAETSTLDQIIARNSATPGRTHASFACQTKDK